MALIHPEQVEITGNHNVSRAERARNFPRRPRPQRAAHSARRAAAPARIDSLGRAGHGAPRACRTRLRSRLSSARPSRFCARGSDMALVDVHGVILDRPAAGEFSFSRGDRDRLRRCPPTIARSACSFLPVSCSRLIRRAPGALEQVSEVDLSRRARFARDAHRPADGRRAGRKRRGR